MQINFGSRAVSCKIVYYGPGLSGKTTNIEKIHDLMPTDRRGELTSIKTKGDRTLFFDFIALDLGKVRGMNTRFQIYTVPGQVYYNATRKVVLQGADGIVFVADSAPDRMLANLESWRNLGDNLKERNITIDDLPIVIQWNKRDVPGAVPTEEMNRTINTIGAPTFDAVAVRGDGVLESLKCVCAEVCKSINGTQTSAATARRAAPEVRPVLAGVGLASAGEARAPVEAAVTAGLPLLTPAAGGTAVKPVVAVEVSSVRPTATVGPGVEDTPPVAPTMARQVMPMRSVSQARPSRAAWTLVIVASAALALAAGVLVALRVLRMW